MLNILGPFPSTIVPKLRYCATELKPRTKKVDFLTKKIETTTPIPFDQAWSRAYKKVGVCVSIAPYAEKYASQGAENGHFPIQKRSLAFEDQ